MARRAHGDSAKTFDAIVGAAKQVLAEEGANELSLRRVAHVVGLSLGTVQYYFSSKDKLVETCLDEQAGFVSGALQAAAAAIAAGANVEDVLVAGVSGIYRQGLQTRETLRLRVMQALQTQELSAGRSRGPICQVSSTRWPSSSASTATSRWPMRTCWY